MTLTARWNIHDLLKKIFNFWWGDLTWAIPQRIAPVWFGLWDGGGAPSRGRVFPTGIREMKIKGQRSNIKPACSSIHHRRAPPDSRTCTRSRSPKIPADYSAFPSKQLSFRDSIRMMQRVTVDFLNIMKKTIHWTPEQISTPFSHLTNGPLSRLIIHPIQHVQLLDEFRLEVEGQLVHLKKFLHSNFPIHSYFRQPPVLIFFTFAPVSVS